MARLGKLMGSAEEGGKDVHAKKRLLKKEVSEATLASDGFPAMLATQSGDEDDGSAAETSAAGSSCPDLQKSPPPVLKTTWRAAAGKTLKKPAAKTSLAQGQALKKPAANSGASSEDGARGGPDAIHQASVKLGGGKAQSYIQHQPEGPGRPKRLVVACTASRAKSLKVTHKALVEELLPKCLEASATKQSSQF